VTADAVLALLAAGALLFCLLSREFIDWLCDRVDAIDPDIAQFNRDHPREEPQP
jgi:hypothetical protein